MPSVQGDILGWWLAYCVLLCCEMARNHRSAKHPHTCKVDQKQARRLSRPRVTTVNPHSPEAAEPLVYTLKAAGAKTLDDDVG